MASKFRTPLEIRQAACSGKLLERYRAYQNEADKLHSWRARLRFPSERLSVVLAYYGAEKLSDIPAEYRDRAEAVAAHDKYEVVRFSTHAIDERLDRLNADAIVTEFAAAYRRELEREIGTVMDALTPIFAHYGLEHEVPACGPVRFLRSELDRQVPCVPGQGGNAVAACFRGIT